MRLNWGKERYFLKRFLHAKMIFLSVCVFFLVLVFLDSRYVFAEDAFDQFQLFKEETLSVAYSIDEYLPLMDMNQAQVTLGELSSSHDEMQQILEGLHARKETIQDHYTEAKAAISQIVSDMKKTHDSLLVRQRDISLTVGKIQSLERIVNELTVDIQQTQHHIALYAKMLFKVTNDYYIEDEEISALKLLSKSDNIAETLSKDDLIRLLYTSLDHVFLKIESYYSQYRTSLQNIRVTVNTYNDEIQVYKHELNMLEKQRDHTIELLTYLDDDVSYLQGRISEIDSSQSEIKEQMNRMEEIADSTVTFLDDNSAVRELLDEHDRREGPTYFSRPVRFVEAILSSTDVGMYADQQGLILHAEQGSSIHAPAPGIVYKVSYNKDLRVNRVILLHKYGYSTLVMPLEEVFVQQGDVVKRGEIIGTAGGKPGLSGSGIGSLRSHVYLELLKNGKPIDPYLHYDMSVFAKKDQLEERYYVKWKQDVLGREVDLSGLPTLKGDTIEERRDYFLSRSGGPVFGDPDMWLRAAKGTGIDPLFGICIGAAETSFRNFKSGNNIGNVGNDDSGNTRTFSSPEQGIRAVFNTLNNKYLRQYHTMDKLSRFGNKNGYIYASAPYNWQKNIMRCLSMIYQQPVPEDYFFRDIQ